jgi:hypothetical protein
MMQAATGVVFLMTSLYGSGHANTQNAAVADSTEAKTVPIVRTLTDSKEVEAYVRREYADTPILVEIARCESTFRQYDEKGMVIRGRIDDRDVGVMQINTYYHGERAEKLGYDIYSIEGNLGFAHFLYEKYGTSPWSASKACWDAKSNLAKK